MESKTVDEILMSFSEGKTEPIVEGKSKIIFPTEVEDVFLMKFKPHLRSLTYNREEDIPETDYWRTLNALDIMLHLENQGIPTQLKHGNAVYKSNEEGPYLLVAGVQPIPIEWICRYEAAGSIVRNFPGLVEEGQKFKQQLQKYDFKQDINTTGVDDPTMNESYIVGLGLLTPGQLDEGKDLLYRVGEAMRNYLQQADIELVDMKIEFGFDQNGRIIVIDEISQDGIRATDLQTGKSLTKDIFRNAGTPDEVVAGYETFAKRLNPEVEARVYKVK